LRLAFGVEPRKVLPCYPGYVGKQIRQKLAALVTTLIFGLILYKVLERTFVLIWVNTPWWGLLIMMVVLFLLIDYMVGRLFGTEE
jgi:hypothetical protein